MSNSSQLSSWLLPVEAQPSERIGEASANLRVLGALLALDGSADGCASLLDTLAPVFGFDQALLLDIEDTALRCLAACPSELRDGHWPGRYFQSVIDGQVLVADGCGENNGWQQMPAVLVAPDRPALAFPIGIGDSIAVMLMLRGPSAPAFADDHVAMARQCAVVTMAALAARNGSRLAGEVARLNGLVADLRQREQQAEQDRSLLKNIIDTLPTSVTVQDDQGRFILVNSAAAARLSMPQDRLIGVSPELFLPKEESEARHSQELTVLHSGESRTIEENVTGANGSRVWLTSQRPVRILDKTLLVSSAYDITERKRIEDDLTQRAYFDELTGLPNRLLIQGHVDDILRRADANRRFALAFIDLDNFKHINDYYSHAIGDALLVKVAERIGQRLRESDVLSRISGDEFLLILNPIEDAEQVRTVINQLIDDLKQPFYIEAFEIFTSASIGVSFFPEHGDSYEALRRNADNAMYRAKAGTKGDAIYFDVAMGKTITARMEHEQRLRLAIRDCRFCCAFQPKVDIHTEEVVGFETLVRWRDDDGEIHPPSSFVGLAVELGLIDPITHFILSETVKSMDRLDASFGPDTTFSLNVAAKQAGDLKFMRSFAEAIKASNRAERIMVEVTEEAFVAKSLFQMEILPLLRNIGVRVSIDDFGTGYSSLSVLSEITADEVKVDRSFITDIHLRPRSQSILRTIESLGHSLGMSIIAEGVETYEELAYLHAATRIRYAQGYYFSKPFFLDGSDPKRLTGEGRELEPAREGWGRKRPRMRSGSFES